MGSNLPGFWVRAVLRGEQQSWDFTAVCFWERVREIASHGHGEACTQHYQHYGPKLDWYIILLMFACLLMFFSLSFCIQCTLIDYTDIVDSPDQYCTGSWVSCSVQKLCLWLEQNWSSSIQNHQHWYRRSKDLICSSLEVANCIKIVAPCVFGNTNDTGIGSSAVKCGASAEVPWAPYQLLYCVLVCWLVAPPN